MALYECRARGTITGNGTTEAIVGRWRDKGQNVPDRIDIHVTGTWDSASVKIQYSVDGGTTKVDVPADKEANLVTLTANGVMTVKARYPLLYLTTSSAGGTTSLVYVAL